MFDQQTLTTRNFNKLSPTAYSTLFSNRIHPPLAIFYLLLCMIPVTLQTSTIAKPRNLCNGSCTLIPLIWRRFNDIIVFHASVSSFLFFSSSPHDRALHFLNPFHRAEDYFTILRCHGISCVYDATLTSPARRGKNGGTSMRNRALMRVNNTSLIFKSRYIIYATQL